MIAAFDVHYLDDACATAAAVLFFDYSAKAPESILSGIVRVDSGYIPGRFYKRELPCILSLLEKIDPPPEEIIIKNASAAAKRR